MNLRQQAIQDACSLLNDEVNGPGWPVVVTDPNGEQRQMLGITTDIGEEIDPDTGVAVSGRKASVALHIRTLTEAGLGLPVNVSDQSRRPWLVAYDNSEGVNQVYKVMDTMPDTALGLVTCMLELYQS